ncbi:MAG: chemotaxis protein CheB [Lacipirellulaceae bacterium]
MIENEEHATSGKILEEPSQERLLTIVGLGASAGGLNALERFFDNVLPCDSLAYVVVQHLSPDFKSLMGELLSRHTTLDIQRVEDGMRVEANTVYLIPPKKEMVLSDGKLLLSDLNPDAKPSLPIDTFFRSLAIDCRENAVGIILSGTGSDGSRGVQAIKEQGGLVLVQEPETASFDGMPLAAIDSGSAHRIFSPQAMPMELLRHVRDPRANDGISPEVLPEDALKTVFRLLHEQYDIDFSHYKAATVLRRIERRLDLLGVDNLEAYVQQLPSDHQELSALYGDLLIGVTRFFRDSEAFDLLERSILPEIVQTTGDIEEIRVWISACATGEEAYSIAILLHECVRENGRKNKVKIFATDVHQDSLEFASQGFYPEELLSHVSQERLDRYFTKENGGWRVSPELRKMIVFAKHNTIKDAPFTKIDLVTCRNFLIYLKPSAQKKALSLFHFALKQGRFLFLGPSETCGELNHKFSDVDQHWRIYRKKRDVRLVPEARLPVPSTGLPQTRIQPARKLIQDDAVTQAGRPLLKAYDILLEKYVPSGFLINERLELLHVFSGAGRFLKLSDGRPSSNLRDCLGLGLRGAVTSAVQKSIKNSEAVKHDCVALIDSRELQLTVEVTPLQEGLDPVSHYLVQISPRSAAATELKALPAPNGTSVPSQVVDEPTRTRIATLEQELLYSRETLQANTEEMETTNEELQATNEELVASNEELQSTNEELHSVNEELYTVNAEHQRKIQELMVMTDDMNNLFRSTEVGTLFLDRNLCIRKITPKITETFSILPQDVGRRINGFTHSLRYEKVFEDVEYVLRSEDSIQREVRDNQGRWFLMRILPYRADSGVDGVVLSLIDISMQKEREFQLVMMSKVFLDAGDPKIVEDFSGRILNVNNAMTRIFGWSRDELLGEETLSVIPSKHHQKIAELRQECRNTGSVRDIELTHKHKSGESTDISLTLTLLSNESGEPVAIAWMSKDISRRKRAEEERQNYSTQLEQTNQKLRDTVDRLLTAEKNAVEEATRREEFLAMLSHELRNPMGALLNATHVLQRRFKKESSKGPIQIIQRQAQHVGRLLDDLLDVSRVSRGKIETRPVVLDLCSLINDAKEVVAPLMNNRKHTFSIESAKEPLLIEGDRIRLLQVIENLLVNAAKYTPDGGQITLSLGRKHDQAIVEVADNGIGIEPHMLDGIFDLFVQSKTGEDSGGGMGVGLTLVRQLVELHGGTVKAASEGLGKGSTFSVLLPITDKPLEQTPTPARPKTLRKPEETDILLVEDNQDARQMLEEVLQLEGYRVRTASDGKEALAIIDEKVPNVAIVDIGLPEVDGYEIARAVRQKNENQSVRLVALTGYGRESDRVAIKQAGFDKHLVKPVNPEVLSSILLEL